MLRNSKLYLVLDTEVASYSRLYEIAKGSIPYGVDMIELRDKNGSAKDMLNFSLKVMKFLKNRIPYIINDRIDLAVAARASGVHLGQDDLPVAVARKIMGKKAIIGVSCQNIKQAREAQREGADYIGFGSVFKTLTKPHRRPLNLKLLAEVVRRIKIPLFAIGGIDIHKLPYIQKAGVKRIAVTRAICCAKDIGRTTIALKKSLEFSF